MTQEIHLMNDADELTQRFMESADAPTTAQPKSRTIGTEATFPASAVCNSATYAEAVQIARLTRPFMDVPLNAERIEEIITAPPGHYSPLMQAQSVALVRAMYRAQMAAFEALKYAVVTGAATRKESKL